MDSGTFQSQRDHALMQTPGKTLTPAQLRERSTIYRANVAQPEVDAFRDLRTKLLSMMDGNFVTLIAPVSAGCGSSFVARNLAAAFAFDDARTALLLDCDMRHPSQHEVMRIDMGNAHLGGYLQGQVEDITPLIHDTGVPRLGLIPAGPPRENSAEQFATPRMRLLVDSLRSHYANRYLFLDAPPVESSPDARILAEMADIVVLVTGYAMNTAETIARAVQQFPPEKFAGVVFNDMG